MAREIFQGYLRLANFPLDGSTIFSTLPAAEEYAASNPTAYPGQVIAVVDSEESEVLIFIITFPYSLGHVGTYELKEIAGLGTINIINDKLPDENGVITIYGTDIKISESNAQTITEFLNNIDIVSDETTIYFEKILSVGKVTGIVTESIDNDTDAINKEYLDITIASNKVGISRTVLVVLTNTGRAAEDQYFDIPAGAIIKKVVVNITQAYTAEIVIKVGEQIIIGADEIFETEIGTYIKEPNLLITTTNPVSSVITGSATGTANVYIDYILQPYDID